MERADLFRLSPPDPCSSQRFAFKHNLYRLREERDIKPSSFAQVGSCPQLAGLPVMCRRPASRYALPHPRWPRPHP